MEYIVEWYIFLMEYIRNLTILELEMNNVNPYIYSVFINSLTLSNSITSYQYRFIYFQLVVVLNRALPPL